MVSARAQPRRVRDWMATGIILVGAFGILLPLSGIRANTPSLALSPTTVVAGAIVDVRGSGFDRGAGVKISFVGHESAGAARRVGRTGTFHARLAVPQLAPGTYAVAASQSPSAKAQVSEDWALVASGSITVVPGLPAAESPRTTTSPLPTATATATATATPIATLSATPTPTPLPSAVAVTPAPAATPGPTTVAPAPANPPIGGFVTRSGTDLVANGAPYRFTGFNIYNANGRSNCSYPMVGGPLDRALTDIGAGAEVFRAWFFQKLATTNGARDWTAFDSTLAAARAHNVRVIVTLGDHWGACESTGVKSETWYATGYRDSVFAGDRTTYREFVREIVSRYGNDPTILMWQMMNEAESKSSPGVCSAVSVLSAFATDIGSLVKSIDPNHLVSLGTIGGGQCATAGADYATLHSIPVIDVCEYHDYSDNAPLPGDQWNGIAVRIAQCNAIGKPLFVGELGRRPQDAGGTLQTRADVFGAKFNAQFAAGIDGILLWGWRNGDQGGSAVSDYDIGPGDPALAHVRSY